MLFLNFHPLHASRSQMKITETVISVAIRAMEVGADGIVVSNHGGRQLDYTSATITVLKEVVCAVQGKIPVLLDGGARRGTDIFKALALGAQAIMIGRPVIFGLAAMDNVGWKV